MSSRSCASSSTSGCGRAKNEFHPDEHVQPSRVPALTETLLHFLWEGLLIGVSTACLAWLCRNGSPRLRYGVHAASLALMVLSVPVTFLLIDGRTLPALRPAALAPTIASRISIEPSGGAGTPFAVAPHGDFDMESAPAVPLVAADFHVSVAERASRGCGRNRTGQPACQAFVIPRIVAPAGIALRRLHLSVGCSVHVGASRARPVGSAPVKSVRQTGPGGATCRSDPWQAARIGLKIVPVVAFCERVTIPFVAGVLRPVILLPDWLEADSNLNNCSSSWPTKWHTSVGWICW